MGKIDKDEIQKTFYKQKQRHTFETIIHKNVYNISKKYSKRYKLLFFLHHLNIHACKNICFGIN